jgi:signal transduction histidine kinase
VRRLQVSRQDPETASYAAAYRLLSQLRVVSRQLSGGLDATSLSHSLLQSLRVPLGYDRGAVYVRSPGGVLVPYAVEGAEQVEWDTDLSGDSPLAEAWSAQRPVVAARGLSGAMNGYAAVLPLHIGVRTIGLVALERDDAFPLDQISASAELANEAALRLETALLFAEVRQIATAEERRRVAREIHDGIAQELASLGYFVDDLAAREQQPGQRESLVKLRQELSRVITELRLSIFDLRNDVQQNVGLGTALADYVRQVGIGSQLIVHLELDETPSHRLPIETEAELLRIAQEAVTNARKHAGAQNLWVTCRIDAPSALLRVEDDGSGLQTPRLDSFGLEIMHERAARIGAALEISDRGEGGTCVELILGDPGNVAGDDRPAA